MEEQIIKQTQDAFAEKFGTAPTYMYFSPGRVNLIGEHTDYNGGHVFPCAITLGTYAAVAERTDNRCRLYSLNFPDAGIKEFSVINPVYNPQNEWANYPMGVFSTLANAGHHALRGLDIAFYGNLPNGAGLSSSASIEVLTAVIIDEIFKFGLPRVELVKLAQKAENEFVGMKCGIMDQFAVGMGKKDNAILLDCNTLKYRYSELQLNDCSIIITNTNKPHNLVTSAYNERRQQAEHALAELKTVKNIATLGDLTNEEFDAVQDVIKDPTERRRARHAVYENRRTLAAVEALEQNDVAQFGRLMNDSHISLRDDYEVTGPELDTLAELAWREEGVLGSRMTGGGFSGCTVSIVQKAAIENFKAHLTEGYTKKIGYAPSFYVAAISDGTHKIS